MVLEGFCADLKKMSIKNSTLEDGVDFTKGEINGEDSFACVSLTL